MGRSRNCVGAAEPRSRESPELCAGSPRNGCGMRSSRAGNRSCSTRERSDGCDPSGIRIGCAAGGAARRLCRARGVAAAELELPRSAGPPRPRRCANAVISCARRSPFTAANCGARGDDPGRDAWPAEIGRCPRARGGFTWVSTRDDWDVVVVRVKRTDRPVWTLVLVRSFRRAEIIPRRGFDKLITGRGQGTSAAAGDDDVPEGAVSREDAWHSPRGFPRPPRGPPRPGCA